MMTRWINPMVGVPGKTGMMIWHAARDCVDSKDMLVDSKETRIAAVLLASAHVGPNARRIARLLAMRESIVSRIGRQLRKTCLWRGCIVHHSDWHGINGGLALCLDVCVAMGLMKRVKVAKAESSMPEAGKEPYHSRRSHEHRKLEKGILRH